MDKILPRILRKAGVADLVKVLSEQLSSSDLQTLLLEVFSRKTSRMTASDLLQAFNNDFVQPSRTDIQRMMELDQIYFKLTKGTFEFLELSPVAPLGSCSIVATAHQNKIVSTIRNTEVVADCTNVLALECAVRRKKLLSHNPKDSTRIRLCSSHRHVRTQSRPDPRLLAHFRILGLVTAGRDTGNFSFELESLIEHFRFYLMLMSDPDLPYVFKNVEVLITDLSENEKRSDIIRQSLIEPMQLQFPNVSVDLYPQRKSGRGYYLDLCFHVNAIDSTGEYFNLADGGFTDWTQQLLNNRKERLLISGIGSELICQRFRKT